jgi:hypothetical protein
MQLCFDWMHHSSCSGMKCVCPDVIALPFPNCQLLADERCHCSRLVCLTSCTIPSAMIRIIRFILNPCFCLQTSLRRWPTAIPPYLPLHGDSSHTCGSLQTWFVCLTLLFSCHHVVSLLKLETYPQLGSAGIFVRRGDTAVSLKFSDTVHKEVAGTAPHQLL